MNTIKNKNFIKKGGFITMFSVLIFGSVSLAIASSVLLLGLGYSKTGFIIEQSGKAKSLANLCAEVALQEIKNSSAFVGSNNIVIDSDFCDYSVIDNGGEDRAIITNGTTGNVVRKILITINQINPSINILSWQEIS
ncbi:MAG: hypothetical protein WAV10_03495 [Minisyncoccia bacterium]